ncbi:MAG: transketolase [Bacilli bacterium]
MNKFNELDKLAVAAIRSMAIDMINKANSGHPGMALGSAPILYVLYKNHMIADPFDSTWINRDRFVLSAGHASSLLYVMIHLAEYPLTLEDLKQFRQLNSLTPGHPEYLHTPGVDATSGPLGQGIAQAVGIALAETNLKASYNSKFINHYTYCLCGDGCLEEGLSHEAISFAGLNNLNKLILFYDANKVTLDGPLANSENGDVRKRFEAAHWNVLEILDGNDLRAIDEAIVKAKESTNSPTIIIVNTVIGYGAPAQGTHKVHGSPIKGDDIAATKKFYGYDYPEFTIPKDVYDLFKQTFVKRGVSAHTEWLLDTKRFRDEKGNEGIEFLFKHNVSKYINNKDFTNFVEGSSEATRKSSEKALNYYDSLLPNLIGGSADVAGSVLTTVPAQTVYSPTNRIGRSMNFGIREFEMASIANGMLLHSGLRPYVGCFLVFADYMKSAIRMAALSKLPAIYLFSHDSISVGEDGPTHQPIEQLAMLRSIPNVNVIRPCDARETYAAYKNALLSLTTPTAIITTRHNLPFIATSSYEGLEKGAYIISKEKNKCEFVIIGTGSEVSLAIEAQKILASKDIDTRVVSMPSMFNFEKQNEEYMEEILGKDYNKRIFVEMASSFGLYKYAKHVMSIDEFGRSAPFSDVQKFFKFTSEELANKVENILKRK